MSNQIVSKRARISAPIRPTVGNRQHTDGMEENCITVTDRVHRIDESFEVFSTDSANSQLELFSGGKQAIVENSNIEPSHRSQLHRTTEHKSSVRV